jgi:hypothetical protein
VTDAAVVHAFEYMKRRARGVWDHGNESGSTAVFAAMYVSDSAENTASRWYSFSDTFSLISVPLEC